MIQHSFSQILAKENLFAAKMNMAERAFCFLSLQLCANYCAKKSSLRKN